jgi:glycerol-3-phosphate acyltransferase PlsY
VTFLPFILLTVSSYLLGSIPFGLLIAKAHGKDIRSIGSGNIGATNVSRALGRKWAYVCFTLDVLKGLIPMLAARPFALRLSVSSPITGFWLLLLIGCAAILGHVLPIYLKFKGGKGVATSFGVALGLWPYFTFSALVVIIVWIAVVLIWRYVSLASIAAALAFPLVLLLAISIIQSWDFNSLWPLLAVATLIPLFVIFRHRENIKRLIAGTENRILEKPKS